MMDKNEKMKCKCKCNLCEHYDKTEDVCKIKNTNEFSKKDAKNCESFLINDRLVNF